MSMSRTGSSLLRTGLLAFLAALVVSSIALADSPNNQPLAKLTWSLGAPIPNAHQESAGTVVKNQYYVISGSSLSCSDAGGGTLTNAVDIYDPRTDTWSSGPPVNIARNEYPLAEQVGNNVFLIGGTSPCGPTVRQTEMLDLSTNTWTVLSPTADLPPPLDGGEHCGVAIDNDIYYFQSSGIGVFDTVSQTWTVLPASPLLTPSLFCRATHVGNQAVITGAGDGSADPFSQRILVFDKPTGSVTLLGSVTVSLAEHTSALLRGRVVVAGGDFSGERSVQAIHLSQSDVTTITPLPVNSDDAVGGVIGDRYYILGGNNTASNLPPVLIGTP